MRLQAPLLLFLCVAIASAQKRTVFLITDAEGVGGVCRQDQTDPNNAELKQLLTGEINAAVEGFLAGGADEVLVWDGHDGSQTLSTLTIHPRARLVDGIDRPQHDDGTQVRRCGLRGAA
jgi:D-amino peptidase